MVYIGSLYDILPYLSTDVNKLKLSIYYIQGIVLRTIQNLITNMKSIQVYILYKTTNDCNIKD